MYVSTNFQIILIQLYGSTVIKYVRVLLLYKKVLKTQHLCNDVKKPKLNNKIKFKSLLYLLVVLLKIKLLAL